MSYLVKLLRNSCNWFEEVKCSPSSVTSLAASASSATCPRSGIEVLPHSEQFPPFTQRANRKLSHASGYQSAGIFPVLRKKQLTLLFCCYWAELPVSGQCDTLLWMHQLRNPGVEVRGSQEKSLAQLFFISINPPSGRDWIGAETN